MESARALASAGAHIIITTRDMTKGVQIVEEMKKTSKNEKIEAMKMDLTSLQSVKNFVSEFRSHRLALHILICK